MRFALTDDQIEFRDAVRALLADTCAPDAIRGAWSDPALAGGGAGGGAGRVPAAWSALAEMGVLGICVPEADGGLGMTDEDLVPLLIEVGRAGLPDPVSSTAGVAAGFLRDHVPAGLARAWLPRIASGDAAFAVAFEGSDLVTAASTADAFLLCRQDEVHLLEPAAVRLVPATSVDGARDLARVEWTAGDETLVAPGERCDDGFAAVNAAFDRAALGAAAMLVGLGQRMLEMTVGLCERATPVRRAHRELPGRQAPARRCLARRRVRLAAGAARRELTCARRPGGARARVDGQGEGLRRGACRRCHVAAGPRCDRLHRRVRPAPVHEACVGAGVARTATRRSTVDGSAAPRSGL